MAAPRILVVGSINVDIVALTERLPTPGETVTGGTLLINHGGKGRIRPSQHAVGAGMCFIGCVGEDTFGLKLQQSMAAEGIGVEGSRPLLGCIRALPIVVDAAGRNQIAVASGANLSLTVDWVARFREDFAWAQVVICQLEVPLDTVLWTLRTARQHGVTTVLNPAPAQPVPSEIWPLVDYLTPNEVEAVQVSGLPLAARCTTPGMWHGRCCRARGRHPHAWCAGALVGTRDHMVHVPALPVSVVDTTAAGDAFNGAFAVALAGVSARRGRALCNAAAGLACTQRGAQNSLPVRTQAEGPCQD